MACPRCQHTMSNLGLAQAGSRTFWCPRCGTLKTETGQHVEYSIPRYAATEIPELLALVKLAGERGVNESWTDRATAAYNSVHADLRQVS